MNDLAASPQNRFGTNLVQSMFTLAEEQLVTTAPVDRQLGCLRVETRSSSRDADRLLTQAFGAFPATHSPETSRRMPAFRVDVLDGVSLDDEPDLDVLVHVGQASTQREPGARARWHDGERRILAYADTDAIAVFDAHARRAVMAYASVATLPWYERAAPMRDLLHWMHMGEGTVLIHAAAVAVEAAGVLIVGPGGRGKSTLATTALLQGFDFAGDDYVAVEPKALLAHGLYRSVKVHASDAPRYTSHLGSGEAEQPDADGKIPLFLKDEPAGFRGGMPLVAIAVPSIGAPFLGWQPTSKVQALKALAPSTLFQTSGDRERVLAACASLVRNLPTVAWNPGPLDDGYEARVVEQLRAIAVHGASA